MNRTERLIIILTLSLFAFISILVLVMYSLPFLSEPPAAEHTQAQQNFLKTLPLRMYSTIGYGIILFGCAAAISLLLRKTNYPEFTFFIFGLLSFAGIGTVNLPPVLILSGHPVPAAILFLRLFYLFWFLAVMFFFLAGLFPNGIPNLKQHTFLMITVVGTVTIILITPIDTVYVLNSFPYYPVHHELLPWFIRSVAVLAVLNLVIAGFRSNSRRYMFAALGMGGTVGGTELFFISQSWSAAAGPLCIAGGTFLYSWMIHKEYLWS